MKEQAYLVSVYQKGLARARRTFEEEELAELTRSAGGVVAGQAQCSLERPTSNYYVGSGKLQEIAHAAHTTGANLVIFNVDLSPVQARNIEEACGRRIVDRTGLILDIFARRAVTHAGKLQVELAQLNYLLPRLTGRGVLLSRLGGGIGTRGPGEQKLEIDRRRIRERIDRLKRQINKLKTHRSLLRAGRRRKNLRVVALVGYANSGKSTLLNSLTGAHVLAEDKFFATLDPKTSRLNHGASEQLLFTDTVGFVARLPHHLIEAFQATLEEVREADMLVHVLDIMHPDCRAHNVAVKTVLQELGVEEKPMVLALNKIDLATTQQERERLSREWPTGTLISAKTGEEVPALVHAVHICLAGHT